MTHTLKNEGKYTYLEVGEGTPIIILHGLMGGLSNFDGVTRFFSENSGITGLHHVSSENQCEEFR